MRGPITRWRERRFYEFQNFAPLHGGGMVSLAGTSVTLSSTMGLPGCTAAVRLVSETLGMMPLKIYRGEDPSDRELDRESWQWMRLHDQPNEDQAAFEFWQDVQTSIETHGNAYIRKLITRRPVVVADDIELVVLDPNIVVVKRDQGRKIFEVSVNGKSQTFTSKDVLHIRGWSVVPGADAAMSPISLHRESLGKILATEGFEARFFTNNAAPPVAIKVEKNISQAQADEMLDQWAQRYGGVSNAFRPAMLKNGADIAKLGFSLADAQFIEQKRFGLEEISRIFRISAVGLIGAWSQGARAPVVDDDFHRFLEVDMHPRIVRVESALRRDADLFPDRELFPEFLTAAVLRPDIQSRYAAYKDGTQGGWLTGNDIRPLEGLPLHPQGDNLQQTPVGGAPNTSVGQTNGQALQGAGT